MTFQHVPSEVLDKIFQQLPQSSIWTCITVCKSWNSTAARIYYTTIHLNTKQGVRFITSLADPTYTFQSIDRGLWVKHLILVGDNNNLTKKEFRKLLSLLSNLKTIDLSAMDTTEDGEDLIAYLVTLLSNYKSLSSSADQQEDLPSGIEEIKINADVPREVKEMHFLANYAYRESITHLHMNYLKKNLGSGGGDVSKRYLDLLPQFTSLTHLSIYNDLLTGDRYMVIYNVLKACPQLVLFQLHTTRHFPDGSQPILLRYIEQDLQQLQQQQSHHQLTLNTRHHQAVATTTPTLTTNIHLKKLNFHMHDFDVAYMKYVIHYTTPNQLLFFKLHMSDTNFYDWLIEKEEVVNEFGFHLRLVQNLEIAAFTPSVIPRRRFGLLRPTPTITTVTPQEKMMRHWQFINNVIGGGNQPNNDQLHVHVYLSMNGYYDFQNFKLKKVDQLLILKYGLKPQHPHNNLIFVLTPHSDQQHAGPNMIDSLEVGDAVRYTLQDCLDTVQHALKYCPRLNFFLLNRRELCWRFEGFSIPHIEFENIKIPIGQGREYIKDKQQQQRQQQQLNHVSLTGTTLSSEFVSVLTQYIPNMQVLILNSCTIPIHQDYQGRGNMTLNLKGIHHLHYLQLDLIHTTTRPFACTYVALELQNETFFYQGKNMYDDQEGIFLPISAQDYMLKMEEEEVVGGEEEMVKAPMFLTIQCDQLNTVALRKGVNDVKLSVLKPVV